MGIFRRSDSRNKSKVWWINYMTGARQHRESTGSTNKKVAEKLLALRKTQVLEERWNLPRSRTPQLGKQADEFLASKTHEKTRSRYQSSINNLLRYFGEKIRLSDLNAESIFRFQQKRLTEGAGKATVNRDVATLSALMSQAKRMRLISHNPCVDVCRLNERRDRRQAEPLSYEEEARVKQFSPEWLSVLITLLVETGLRVRKEALPLKWSDVLLDSEPACVHVRESKSAAGLRTVWLTDYCRDALIRWRGRAGLDFSPYVFASPRIANAHITDYKTAWRKAARKAGLARRIYDLRASFASRANSCKATGLTVAHLLGHASTQILPTYVKPLDENTKVIIEALDAARRNRSATPPAGESLQ
jgi:integrase